MFFETLPYRRDEGLKVKICGSGLPDVAILPLGQKRCETINNDWIKDRTFQADLASSSLAAVSQVHGFSCLNLAALLVMHMQNPPLREQDYDQISGHMQLRRIVVRTIKNKKRFAFMVACVTSKLVTFVC